jgi:hypothetical protein
MIRFVITYIISDLIIIFYGLWWNLYQNTFFFRKYIYKKFLAREFSGYTIIDEKELNIYFIY